MIITCVVRGTIIRMRNQIPRSLQTGVSNSSRTPGWIQAAEAPPGLDSFKQQSGSGMGSSVDPGGWSELHSCNKEPEACVRGAQQYIAMFGHNFAYLHAPVFLQMHASSTAKCLGVCLSVAWSQEQATAWSWICELHTYGSVPLPRCVEP